MSMIACATSTGGNTRCPRAAHASSPAHMCSANSAFCASSARSRRRSREPGTKPVGEPDAGDPHVRFDERGEETERWQVQVAPSHRASPRLYCTAFVAALTPESVATAKQLIAGRVLAPTAMAFVHFV